MRPAATTAMLRDYLAMHPRGGDPTAPLFPGVSLLPPRPTRDRKETGDEQPTDKAVATRQTTALADLSVAEAGERLLLDWSVPIRHATFYKAVYRPAVLRANRLTPRPRYRRSSSFTPSGARTRASVSRSAS